ncbi:hypothetical protein MLD63_17050 [Paracoccus sp. TK19116]|uniref:Uncharacterized protein n=1 Tax=Paracoccus albicereus TaxID=2922394 RepID=A0ABT1MVH8_9RHOB|nr:hypothetical protein [Paracoccus albicereus]MCQ0972129.1 hypothetical protein [Paracoccus albicereus]
MKSLIASAAAAALLTAAAPAFAYTGEMGASAVASTASIMLPTDKIVEKRGRGGRSKPRIPGGSGCDDPRDIIEHPQCR